MIKKKFEYPLILNFMSRFHNTGLLLFFKGTYVADRRWDLHCDSSFGHSHRVHTVVSVPRQHCNEPSDHIQQVYLFSYLYGINLDVETYRFGPACAAVFLSSLPSQRGLHFYLVWIKQWKVSSHTPYCISVPTVSLLVWRIRCLFNPWFLIIMDENCLGCIELSFIPSCGSTGRRWSKTWSTQLRRRTSD